MKLVSELFDSFTLTVRSESYFKHWKRISCAGEVNEDNQIGDHIKNFMDFSYLNS